MPMTSEEEWTYVGRRIPVRGEIVSRCSTWEQLSSHGAGVGDRLFHVGVDNLAQYTQHPWHIWARATP